MKPLASIAVALNETGAPEWIELIPAGETVHGVDGRSWRNPDPVAVVRATNVEARPLPLDWEHATEQRAPQGLDAPAAGWIESLEVRKGAIWGRVAWTAAGRDHVANRHYRFVSPVFTYHPADMRIGRLASAGLTNTPNLQLTALNRAAITLEDPDMEPDDMAQDDVTDATSLIQALIVLLKLPADAGLPDILARVRAMQTEKAANSARPDPAKFVPIEALERVTRELSRRTQGLTDQLADRHVNELIERGRLLPRSGRMGAGALPHR